MGLAELQADLERQRQKRPTPDPSRPWSAPPPPSPYPTGFLGKVLQEVDAEPRLTAPKGFRERVHERAGIPTTQQGWEEHPIRGTLGLLAGATRLPDLAEAVDTLGEKLGIRRPVGGIVTPGGAPQFSLGDIVSQAAGFVPLWATSRLLSRQPPVMPLRYRPPVLPAAAPATVTPPPAPPPAPLPLGPIYDPGRPAIARGSIPQGPVVPPPGPVVRPRVPPMTEAERLAAAREAGFGPRPSVPSAAPAEVQSGQLTQEGQAAYTDLTGEGTLLDAQGRPITAPKTLMERTRERLRNLYKGRAEPRIDLEGRAPTDVGPHAPELPQAPPPDFTLGQKPKAGINRFTLPKRPAAGSPPAPLALPPPDPQGPILGPHGRPVKADEPPVDERERLRSLGRRPLDAPPFRPDEPPPPPSEPLPPGMPPVPPKPDAPSASGRPVLPPSQVPGVFGIDMEGQPPPPQPPPPVLPPPARPAPPPQLLPPDAIAARDRLKAFTDKYGPQRGERQLQSGDRELAQGFVDGQKGMESSARQVHDAHPTWSDSQVSIYLNGQGDGRTGDMTRIQALGLHHEVDRLGGTIPERAPKPPTAEPAGGVPSVGPPSGALPPESVPPPSIHAFWNYHGARRKGIPGGPYSDDLLADLMPQIEQELHDKYAAQRLMGDRLSGQGKPVTDRQRTEMLSNMRSIQNEINDTIEEVRAGAGDDIAEMLQARLRGEGPPEPPAGGAGVPAVPPKKPTPQVPGVRPDEPLPPPAAPAPPPSPVQPPPPAAPSVGSPPRFDPEGQGTIGGTPAPTMPDRGLKPTVAQGERSLADFEGDIARLEKSLRELGAEPPKPSSEAKRFGALGRDRAPREAVARYDAEVKAHADWTRRRGFLIKQRKNAQNALEEAKTQQGMFGPSKAQREAEVEAGQGELAGDRELEAAREAQRGLGPMPDAPPPAPEAPTFGPMDEVFYKGQKRWVAGDDDEFYGGPVPPGHVRIYDPSVPMGHLDTVEVVPIKDLTPGQTVAERAAEQAKWNADYQAKRKAEQAAQRAANKGKDLPPSSAPPVPPKGPKAPKAPEMEQPGGIGGRPQDEGRSMNDVIMEQLGPETEAILAKTKNRFDLPDDVKKRLREMDLDPDMAMHAARKRAADAAPKPVLPPVKPGFVRLYRGEATPGSGKGKPEWVVEREKETGALDASGRWFTKDQGNADWYIKDAGGTGRLVYVDVPEAVVNESLISKLPKDHPARRFSRDPENEHFLPRLWADQKQSAAGGLPAVKVGDTVNTPQGTGIVQRIVGNQATVQLDTGGKKVAAKVGDLVASTEPRRPVELPTGPDPAAQMAHLRKQIARAKEDQDAAISDLRMRWNEGSERDDPPPQGAIRVDPAWQRARLELSRAEAELKRLRASDPKAPRSTKDAGEWGNEADVPDLTNVAHVFKLVSRSGKIKVGEDLAGELRGIPAHFKSRNGVSIDSIAEGVLETWPHLGGGDRAVVKDMMIDTMTHGTKKPTAAELKRLEGRGHSSKIDLGAPPRRDIGGETWEDAKGAFDLPEE